MSYTISTVFRTGARLPYLHDLPLDEAINVAGNLMKQGMPGVEIVPTMAWRKVKQLERRRAILREAGWWLLVAVLLVVTILVWNP